MLDLWGRSSVGRAPALQAGGQEFESLRLHCRIDESFDLTVMIGYANHVPLQNRLKHSILRRN